MSKPLLSLCMPTNGVVEWVFPVLDSIYNQNVDKELFEVVITDNGQNQEFKNKINDYIKSHVNIVYKETQTLPFLNEIESYKLANGELIKFVNHRTKLMDGTINKLLQLIEKYKEEKPIFYFANGMLEISKTVHEYYTFDIFVRNLSYWSSWSTGMTIWKSDLEKIPKDVSSYNELFPHTNILFNERNRSKYIINNEIIFDEIPVNGIPKAKYDLFYAFAVEYLEIIFSLYNDGDITKKTYNYVKRKNSFFVSSLYLEYIVQKKQCSYILDNYKGSVKKYYSDFEIKFKALFIVIERVIRKILK